MLNQPKSLLERLESQGRLSPRLQSVLNQARKELQEKGGFVIASNGKPVLFKSLKELDNALIGELKKANDALIFTSATMQ